MNIPEALRERVSITDHGVVDQLDPETGETIKSYVITYTVVHDGLEHGLTLASTPLLADLPEVYKAALEMGVYGVLAKAGIWAMTIPCPARLEDCRCAGGHDRWETLGATVHACAIPDCTAMWTDFGVVRLPCRTGLPRRFGRPALRSVT